LAVRVGRWYKVGWLIDYFVAHGCVVGELPAVHETPYGLRKIRYLLNPKTNQFVTLTDLDNEESVPDTIYCNWEVMLGVTLPENGTPC
jgi:hypothetical protein